MTLEKDKTQKYIQLYLPKEAIFSKMASFGMSTGIASIGLRYPAMRGGVNV